MPSPFFWGGFGQQTGKGLSNLADLLHRKEELSERKKTSELQRKMLDLQIQKATREEGEAATRERLLSDITQSMTQPAGQSIFQGIEEEGAGLVGPPPAPTKPKTLPEVLQDPAIVGRMIQAQSKEVLPQLLKQAMPNKPGEVALTAEQISGLYSGLSPIQARQIAALPAAAQERTLDNLRAQQGQQLAGERQDKSIQAMNERQMTAQQFSDERQQRMFAQQAELQNRSLEAMAQREKQRQELREQPKPLTAAERKDLRSSQAILDDIKLAKSLYKPQYTGMVQGGVLRSIREKTGTISAEQAKFNSATARVVNKIRNQEFGSALTAFEGAEAMKGLPESTQTDTLVTTKLDDLERIFTTGIARMTEGRPIGQAYPTPAGGPGKQQSQSTSRNGVFNTTTGQIEWR